MVTVATHEVFADAMRSAGDLAGVFEYDGQVGYFYLYAAGAKRRVLRALHVLSVPCSLGSKRVEVRWGEGETVVGLFIAGQVWAVFDVDAGVEYTGNFQAGVGPALPSRVGALLAGGMTSP